MRLQMALVGVRQTLQEKRSGLALGALWGGSALILVGA
jgi:hypothetical protein